MMGEMVDRVAKAMAESRDLIWENMSEFSNADETPEYYRSLARAAIKAMREPTGAMIERGAEAMYGLTPERAEELGDEDKFEADKAKALDTYRRMIDAALSPEQEQG